jgi:hypothetical protein
MRVSLYNLHWKKKSFWGSVISVIWGDLLWKIDYKRNITISITILFVRGAREKKKIKQTFWECVVNDKRNFDFKKN